MYNLYNTKNKNLVTLLLRFLLAGTWTSTGEKWIIRAPSCCLQHCPSSPSTCRTMTCTTHVIQRNTPYTQSQRFFLLSSNHGFYFTRSHSTGRPWLFCRLPCCVTHAHNRPVCKQRTFSSRLNTPSAQQETLTYVPSCWPPADTGEVIWTQEPGFFHLLSHFTWCQHSCPISSPPAQPSSAGLC